MTDTAVTLERGSSLPPPRTDRRPTGRAAITWLEARSAAVSTAGPALELWVDVTWDRDMAGERTVVARVRVTNQYLHTPRSDWHDGLGNLASSAILGAGSFAERVLLVLPYAAFPPQTGGAVDIEIAAHEPSGALAAVATFDVELPPDVDRVPDLLTVTAHTVIAMTREAGSGLDPAALRSVHERLCAEFQLDDVGELALKRIMRTASEVRHRIEDLDEVLRFALPDDAHERFVNLLYRCAEIAGTVPDDRRAFIDELLGRLSIHDHLRLGPERLRPYYDELELPLGASLDEVRRAYKRLVREYHPDRVQHLARGFHTYATEKTARLNEAFGAIRATLVHSEGERMTDPAEMWDDGPTQGGQG